MSNRIWNFIIQDYPRKLLALIFAIMLFWGVRNKVVTPQQLPGVPVEVKLSPELAFATRQKTQVTITVQGSERTLKDIAPEDFATSVYVGPEHRSNVENDTYIVPMHPEMFKQKNGVKIVRSQPLKLHLQRRITKRVQIKTQFTGSLSKEYRCAATRTIPEMLVVSGPELTLNSVDSLFSEPIPLSESVRDSFEYESKIIVPEGLTAEPSRIIIQVDVAKNFEQRHVRNLPILLMQSSDPALKAVLIDPHQQADVLITGLPTVLGATNNGTIRLFADLSAISKPGIYTIPLRGSSDIDGVSVKAVSPGEVQVKVIKLP